MWSDLGHEQYRGRQFGLYHRVMANPIHLDRAGRIPLAAQIYRAIRESMETGRLASGAKLLSRLDLASTRVASRRHHPQHPTSRQKRREAGTAEFKRKQLFGTGGDRRRGRHRGRRRGPADAEPLA
jgi:hypothetical protein